MSDKRLGVTLSEEHKEKCRQASLGNKSRSKAVVCIETGEVYPNMKIAAAAFGINPSAISCVIRGVNVTAGGYHWRYADEDANQGSRRRNLAVICEDTGEYFPTLEAAAAKFGINATTVGKIARGESISKLHFKFAEEITYNEIRTQDKRFGSTTHNTPIICLDNGKEYPLMENLTNKFRTKFVALKLARYLAPRRRQQKASESKRTLWKITFAAIKNLLAVVISKRFLILRNYC